MAAAAAAGSSCRYIVIDTGTVNDLNTLLQWEKKNNTADSVSNVNNTYTWSSSGTAPDGTLFTDFLAKLNNLTTNSENSIPGGFAGHSDWRVPNHVELQTIIDLTRAGCGGGVTPCINAIFGPTVASFYWSSTTLANFPFNAWFVIFNVGFVFLGNKLNFNFARAVRGGR